VRISDLTTALTRRRALALGGLVVASSPLVTARLTAGATSSSGRLPVDEIERIMETDGTVTSGILSLEIGRTDLRVTGPGGIPVKAAWALDHEFHFEPVGEGRAALNGELTVLEEEVDPVVDRLLEGGVELMAVHTHLLELHPPIQYIHYKGVGDPLDLARTSIAAVRRTPTPLPQHSPRHPTTPLDKGALASILGGAATVMDEGVVEVDVPRRQAVLVDGVTFEPDMAVQVAVMFQPLDDGHHAAVMAELPCVAQEVTPVAAALRGQGLRITALHHHEIAERPQLYFMHSFGTGTDVDLAHRVARALDRMSLERR
jgi:Domain of Unknown Function (DUF1259)